MSSLELLYFDWPNSRTWTISSNVSFPSWFASTSCSCWAPLPVPISFSLNCSPYLLTDEEYRFSLLTRFTVGYSSRCGSNERLRDSATVAATKITAAIKYLVDLCMAMVYT
ncbi:hypothetical protein OGATHE_002022 [Ogataea polymorpha]|uniref:Uncharacterized protein n=1 Tax=Ogataea polymorpha TaxID=460523 RepID=A0A9P8PL31_9ASCO|nr:hypothetical protein OGATHE_002022 [Ogataea polymorpha]